MIKAVLFDWDGTLVDSKKAILASYRDATTEVIGRAFPETAEEVARILPMRAQESFGSLSDDPAVVDRLIAAYHVAYLRNSQSLAGAFEHTVATLTALRDRGLQVGVVTSKARDRMESDRDRYGIGDIFAVAVTGDVSAERKPHPGPVIDAMEALGIKGDETVYVGDGPQDVLAGSGAGAVTVLCTYGFHDRTESAELAPDYVIDDVAEVLGIVDALAAG
jgi:phosphoglycolate phosphatase-like HAD superfamily hydrolase